MRAEQVRGHLAGAKLIEDRELTGRSRDGVAAQCRIRLYRVRCGITCEGHYVLLATDLDSDSSVTSMIESIAGEVARLWEIPPAKMLVVEHYDRRSHRLCDGEPSETFAKVRFQWCGLEPRDPKWSDYRREELQAAIGGLRVW